MTSLILIEGPANTGKTTIAWKVLERLWSEATAVRFWDKDEKEITNPEEIWEVRNRVKGENDFHAVVTVRNQTFAITSGGDTKTIVVNGIQWGWRTRVNGIIQAVRDNTPNPSSALNHIMSCCGNMPKVEHITHSLTSPAAQDAEHDDIATKIVKCVMEP